MTRLARLLVELPAALRRWAAYRRLVTSGLAQRDLQRNPDRDRARQALAARQAFLSDLSPHHRALTRTPYGDTH